MRGGFAEIGPEGLTVLAEEATAVEGIDAATIAPATRDAEEDLADAANEVSRDRAKTRPEQLKTLKAAPGHREPGLALVRH